jgi:hypothetical protein
MEQLHLEEQETRLTLHEHDDDDDFMISLLIEFILSHFDKT